MDVVTTFADGEQVREQWDGLDRRAIYTYERPVARGVACRSIRERVLLLDVNYTNNSRTLEPRARRGQPQVEPEVDGVAAGADAHLCVLRMTVAALARRLAARRSPRRRSSAASSSLTLLRRCRWRSRCAALLEAHSAPASWPTAPPTA